MTMEWTREKTLALIQEYRKRRGLWDMTHEDYRKKEVKHKLLVEVGDALGGNIPIMEIEKKFHTLRTQYHREINRMKRKEPYNSKWFGFKCLQFLSSPKACRANKGRIKAEITEEGTVTTKYIIREAIPVQHDTSMGSGNDNDDEEFLTLQRRPTTITYEAVPAGNAATSTSSSRSHELEKLIEETTKDVEEIEDAKPKMIIKEITVPQDHQHQHRDNYAGQSSGELQITNVDTEHEDLHHIEDDNEQMDTINIHTGGSDEEINYHHHQTTAAAGNNGGATSTIVSNANGSSTTTTVHTIPARIIKIQRRDTHDHEQQQQHEYYTQHQPPPPQQHHQHHHHLPQQHQTHQIQTVSPGGATKRIYYDTATILTATPTQQQSSGMTIINASSPVAAMTSPQSSKLHVRNSLAPVMAATMSTSAPTVLGTPTTMISSTPTTALRDEYVTYGEYVANEMRNITSREILISLKHKINTALFEANMQELQK